MLEAPLACLLSMLIGPRGSLSVIDSAQLLWQGIAQSADADAMLLDSMHNVRLPRTVVGFLVGAALAASGMALQAIARNPLVAPDIAGISSGAAFGAALALSTSWLPVQGTAFAFGVAASAATYCLGRIRGRLSTVVAGAIGRGDRRHFHGAALAFAGVYRPAQSAKHCAVDDG